MSGKVAKPKEDKDASKGKNPPPPHAQLALPLNQRLVTPPCKPFISHTRRSIRALSLDRTHQQPLGACAISSALHVDAAV